MMFRTKIDGMKLCVYENETVYEIINRQYNNEKHLKLCIV